MDITIDTCDQHNSTEIYQQIELPQRYPHVYETTKYFIHMDLQIFAGHFDGEHETPLHGLHGLYDISRTWVLKLWIAKIQPMTSLTWLPAQWGGVMLHSLSLCAGTCFLPKGREAISFALYRDM